MKKSFLLMLAWICFSSSLSFAQKAEALLQSGPMVGYSDMREALLWVQTKASAEVHFTYYAEDAPETLYETESYTTHKAEAFTAHLIADHVKPGLKYAYTLYINGKAIKRPYDTHFSTPPLWHYRTDPPEMKIALGSCAKINEETYDRPGKPYGGGYEIFTSIYESKPDLMLWLGDNMYLEPADHSTRTGIIHRHTHGRSTPEMQALLASTPNYAIWDDHDFGPNNSDRSFYNKHLTLEAFKLFWGNPYYGRNEQDGIYSSFEWGDAQFFLVDNRYFRTPNRKRTGGPRTLLGKEQLDWLLDALISSQAKFKFVCIGGQVLNTVEKYENYAALAPEERYYLLNTIVQERVKNVIFLTGDRHHSELSKWKSQGITIYDFTVSPLTSGSHDAEEEPNTLRIPGSHVGIRNYGTMEISGARKERKLVLNLFDAKAKKLWSYEIDAE